MLAWVAVVSARDAQSVGTRVQEDAREPMPWRALSADEQRTFDLGYRVFNTEWVPAGMPAGRIDGLGPLFNAQGCDACHSSRRRGRGPRGDGELPAELVMQLGQVSPGGEVLPGSGGYGYVLNTAAIAGFVPEARVRVNYVTRSVHLAGGASVELREPHYTVDRLSAAPLPANTVLMPRLPPGLHGAGLLELVPDWELARVAAVERSGGGAAHGSISWVEEDGDRRVARFGWGATQPSVASQVAVAFAREMGLTSSLRHDPDCGAADAGCFAAPSGGSPEVEPALFDAVVAFVRLQAVPVKGAADMADPGGVLFAQAGCAQCHRPALALEPERGTPRQIHPYTDLLLHLMGDGLSDRDLDGKPARDGWRTAPLWGLNAAYAADQPVRLLHDGRARSVEEAVLWHDGEARQARAAFMHMDAAQRRQLVSWIEGL
jgi:CxxC motif-containing protein (DUF1111 family)